MGWVDERAVGGWDVHAPVQVQDTKLMFWNAGFVPLRTVGIHTTILRGDPSQVFVYALG